MTAKEKYRSLDLVKGLAKGWGDLNGREMQMLLYVAQFGRQNETGYAFVWHPMKGAEWWQHDMSMAERTYYRTLASLQQDGYLAPVPANENWRLPGFGIPMSKMHECWAHLHPSAS